MKTEGKKLKEFLKSNGLRQEDLVNVVGKSRQTIGAYVSRLYLPRQVKEDIINHYNLPSDYFDMGKEPEVKQVQTATTVSAEQYERLEKMVSYQEKLIESQKEHIDRVEEELSEYKSQRNRQTG